MKACLNLKIFEMKIEFVKSACPIDYGYLAGDVCTCEESFGKQMIELGYARELEESDTLPEDLPGREAFTEAGITSLEEIEKLTDFTEIKGIGEATAKRIAEYLDSKK